MGTLNLGSTQISSSGSTLVIPSNINLGGNWVDAPPGTIITANASALSSTFSTTNDTQQYTGHSCSIVRKLPGGSTSGTSKIFVYLQGGCRDSNSSSGQDVTVLYRSINGGTDSEQRYMDSKYGSTAWLNHSAFYADTSASSGGVGDTITYKMYVRSRGGSHTIYYHNVVGGVSNDVWLIVQEVVN